jgi:hypothetical protein
MDAMGIFATFWFTLIVLRVAYLVMQVFEEREFDMQLQERLDSLPASVFARYPRPLLSAGTCGQLRLCHHQARTTCWEP